MVFEWLWSSGSSNPTVNNLDPSLKDVLKSQESRPSNLPSAEKKTTFTQQLRESGDLPPRRDPNAQPQLQPQSQSEGGEKLHVPPESLYQDGRYAHLWKNYEPLDVLESRGQTEMDKLKRLKEDNDTRKSKVGKAALENCVFEQLAELDCWRTGGTYAKLTMCRKEKKTFLSCYEMQCKFLKALGYWQAVGDPVRADAIQMHSDQLWQRMHAQQEEIRKAKEEGRPVPEFESILSPANLQAVGGELAELSIPNMAGKDKDYPYPLIPEKMRGHFEQRIKKMSKEAAKVEEVVFLVELENKVRMAEDGASFLRAEGDARRERYETGQATMGDRIKRLTNWDAWDSRFPSPADLQARRQAQAKAEAESEASTPKS